MECGVTLFQIRMLILLYWSTIAVIGQLARTSLAANLVYVLTETDLFTIIVICFVLSAAIYMKFVVISRQINYALSYTSFIFSVESWLCDQFADIMAKLKANYF